MTDISIGAGFVTSQTVQSVIPMQTNSPEPSGGSFMESLQQNGIADTAQSDVLTSASAVGGTPKAVSNSGAADNAGTSTAVGAEKAEAPSDTYGASASETETAYETAPKAEYKTAGSVKVDEEAVKELNDLNGLSKSVKEALSAEEEPSLLEQSREALENAMLKAFKDLNDPEKKKEEFEEKALIFLMKLVDKINGRTEKKTALADDEDEDEDGEKLGGVLMQVIDSMLKNAEKNAEEGEADGARKDGWIEDTNFVDSSSSEESARERIRLHKGNLKMEPIRRPDEPPPENYRLPDPMRPRPQSETTDNADGAERVRPRREIGTPLRAAAAIEAEQTPDITAAVGMDDAAVQAGTAEAKAPETVEETAAVSVIRTEVPRIGEAAQPAAPSFVQEETAVQAQPVSEDRPQDGAFSEQPRQSAETVPQTAAPTPITADEEKAPAAESAQTSTVPETAAQTAETIETLTEEGVPSLQPRVTEESEEAPEALRTAEDAEYERIAEDIFRQVSETVKAAPKANPEAEERGGETVPARTVKRGDTRNTLRESAQTGSDSELEELARLFGTDKKRGRPELPEEEEDGGAAERTDRLGAEDKIEVPVEDFSAVTSRTAQAPVLRQLEPTESGVKQIVTQIASEIFNNLPENGGETTVTMTLNPETLGRISVKLVENAGKISVTITAESRETAAILASRAESMQESMRDSGTQLEKYQVVYGAEQDGRAEQQNYDGSSKNPYVREVEEHDDENEGKFAEILGNEVV
ncbi:MAG: flagellar hook-length control protein FliK [Bacteroides sp.]|nr:flagellar hook-length control protein FliK [Bacteroides sp.]